MLVSPAEPKALYELGVVSSKPEMYGCDFLWESHEKLYGVQRKEIKDFIASINDGRLNKEIAQMGQLDGKAVLLIEGDLMWTSDGLLMGRDYGKGYSQSTHTKLLLSVQQKGVWFLGSRNLSDTSRVIRYVLDWSRKAEHRSLDGRGDGIARNAWGRITNRDYLRYLVMGLPGVGPELADRIIDKFGCPFDLRIGIEELCEVEGIGKKKAQQIISVFEKVAA